MQRIDTRRRRRSGRCACASWSSLVAPFALVLGLAAGCGTAPEPPAVNVGAVDWPQNLSEFGLFEGPLGEMRPAEGVVPYDLNTPLFSDYAVKDRLVKLPDGEPAVYHDTEAFDFPVGTVIAKTFSYPHDMRDPSLGRRIVETRILLREEDGWLGLPYVWNADQTDAVLDVAGDMVDIEWIHDDGQPRSVNYIIPNSNQCKGCHKIGDVMQPIGPKARHLNGDFAYEEGVENQLTHWTRTGALLGAPAPADAPRLAVWDDPESGDVDARARAWLEVNCAHCHNPAGPARNSGLDLMASQADPARYGVFKTSVAAGRGTGGRRFDITPGKPEESILMYRIESTEAGAMMPELGKRLVHTEGVDLIREWIASLPDPNAASSSEGG